MDGQILTGIVGFLSALAGVVGTLLATQWRLSHERRTHNRDQLIEFLNGTISRLEVQLATERSERERWQLLALQNLHTLEVADETINAQQKRSEAPT